MGLLMKTVYKFIFMFSFVTLLCGCPVSESILMYNNSGSDVVIKLEERDFQWLAGSKVRIAEKNMTINWESLEWFGDPEVEYIPLLNLQIGEEDKTFGLVFPDLPDDYINPGSIKEYFLQLDHDAHLYVVPSGSNFPVNDVLLKTRVEPFQRH